MIPILFDENERSFQTQGIGAMADTITCTVHEERNGSFELELTYPVSGALFNDLKVNRIVLAVPSYKKEAEPFRIYRITKPLSGIVSVYAEHISYQLSFIPVSQYTATNAAAAVAGLKTHSLEQNPFTFWTDKTTQGTFSVKVPNSCRAVMGGKEGTILDVYGGELEFNRYNVKLHSSRGQNRGVEIRYGKNLTDITQEENIANTITGVIGVYSKDDKVVSAGEVVYSDNADAFPFKRTIVVDFSSEFQNATPTADQLKGQAQAYIEREGIGIPKVSIDVEFLALEQFEEFRNVAMLEAVNLCDIVTVVFEDYGINATAKVVKTDWDVLAEKYEKVTIGEARTSLSKTISEVSDAAAAAAQKDRDNVQNVVEAAINTLAGADGGNVVISRYADGTPYELLILDADNIAAASKVWRWNQGGLSLSRNGYGGPYEMVTSENGYIKQNFIESEIEETAFELSDAGAFSFSGSSSCVAMKSGGVVTIILRAGGSVTASTAGAPVYTLEQKYRPKTQIYTTFPDKSGKTIGLGIDSAGAVKLYNTSGVAHSDSWLVYTVVTYVTNN